MSVWFKTLYFILRIPYTNGCRSCDVRVSVHTYWRYLQFYAGSQLQSWEDSVGRILSVVGHCFLSSNRLVFLFLLLISWQGRDILHDNWKILNLRYIFALFKRKPNIMLLINTSTSKNEPWFTKNSTVR